MSDMSHMGVWVGVPWHNGTPLASCLPGGYTVRLPAP
jgi:hypothetical protein